MSNSSENVLIYENDGINSTTIKETFYRFEDELYDTGYILDLDDEDTKVELRRCMCRDVRTLSITGPLNPSNPAYDNERICLNTPGGRCGMYYCECYEECDWYTGKCSYCDELIESKRKAKRIPMHAGGFKGCLCSNRCVHECLSDNTSAIEHSLVEIMQKFQDIIDTYEDEDFKDRNDVYIDNESDENDDHFNEDEYPNNIEPEMFDI